MKTKVKIKLLSVFAVLSTLALCVQGYYNWRFFHELQELKNNSAYVANTSPNKTDPFSPDWDPFGGLTPPDTFTDMQKRMDEMMQSLSQGRTQFNNGGGGARVDMEDKGDKYEITVQVPQGQNVEVNTKVEDDHLVVSGKVKNDNKDSNENFFSSRSSVSQFSQSLYLPDPVDQAAMTTRQDGNKIIITLPKA